MDYSKIVEIYSTDRESQANMLLKHGWILISTYLTVYDPTIAPNHQTIHFVLGRPFNVTKTVEEINDALEKDNDFFNVNNVS